MQTLNAADADALLDAIGAENHEAQRELRSETFEKVWLEKLQDRLSRRVPSATHFHGDVDAFLSAWSDDFIDYVTAIKSSPSCSNRFNEIGELLWDIPPAVAAVSLRVYELAAVRDKGALIDYLGKIVTRSQPARGEIEKLIRLRIPIFLRMGRVENEACTGPVPPTATIICEAAPDVESLEPPHPDGPDETEGSFWWNNVRHDGLPGTAWRLLKLLWNKRDWKAEFRELDVVVFRDPGKIVVGPDVKNPADDLRWFFKRNQIPLNCRQAKPYVLIERVSDAVSEKKPE
jgi:hypothetical protein